MLDEFQFQTLNFSHRKESVKQSPYFHTLPVDAHRVLIKNKIYLASCLNAIFTGREIDVWNILR